MRPETRYVRAGGAEIAYQVLGDGPLDLVYHHGMCHLDLQWDVHPEAAFNLRLASFARLILFDRRGSGASERLAQGFLPTVDEWSEDLLAVLDAAGSERTAIFAEAEAGPTAIRFAARHPARVSALVLGNTRPRFLAAGLKTRAEDAGSTCAGQPWKKDSDGWNRAVTGLPAPHGRRSSPN